MKLLVVLFAITAIVAGDVSHLNNLYLPPHVDSQINNLDQHVEEQVAVNVKPVDNNSGPTATEDPVAYHVAFAAKNSEQVIVEEPSFKNIELKAEFNEDAYPNTEFTLAAQGEAVEEAHTESHVEVEQAQEVEQKEQKEVEELPATSEYDISPLPEVSNGIDTQYAANGGYVY